MIKSLFVKRETCAHKISELATRFVQDVASTYCNIQDQINFMLKQLITTDQEHNSFIIVKTTASFGEKKEVQHSCCTSIAPCKTPQQFLGFQSLKCYSSLLTLHESKSKLRGFQRLLKNTQSSFPTQNQRRSSIIHGLKTSIIAQLHF